MAMKQQDLVEDDREGEEGTSGAAQVEEIYRGCRHAKERPPPPFRGVLSFHQGWQRERHCAGPLVSSTAKLSRTIFISPPPLPPLVNTEYLEV